MEQKPLKILLVDDSRTQAALLRRGLVGHGHDVVVASDGIEAIERAYGIKPDLIVSDIVMPRLNGYQVCRLLKDDQAMQHIPVVLLTSLDAKQDMFWGLKSGADLYLNKVPDIGALVEDIMAFVKERRLAAGLGHDAPERTEEATGLSGDIIAQVLQLMDKTLFESTVLNEISTLVGNLDDHHKIMFGVLEILSKVIDFDLGMIVLLEDEVCEHYLFVNGPVGDGFIHQARRQTREEMEKVFTQGLPSGGTVGVVNSSNRLAPDDNRAEVASTHFHLLQSKDKPSGIIGLFRRTASGFPPSSIHIFSVLRKQLDIVVDYARLYERNKQLSITDGLTKLYNHRYFQEALMREFNRSARHKSPLSLALIDIDRFKQVNDTMGHQQGDLILSELARLLKRTVRNLDLVARYGGEEFALIMPDAPLDDALRVAERLRKAIEEHPFPAKEGAMRVTVSMGLAGIPSHPISNPADLIRAADQALYTAKEAGRNRVERQP